MLKCEVSQTLHRIVVMYKPIFVINIIIYMYLQHSNVLCI